MGYELTEREVMDNGWRHSTYTRDDGSTFHVGIPSRVDIDGGQPGRRSFDESAEHRMALAVYDGKDG